jgi:hypothetical protein
MATTTPAFPAFLYTLSQLQASGDDAQVLLDWVRSALPSPAASTRISLRLRVPTRAGRKTVTVQHLPPVAASFQFSTAIAVRGHDYGHLLVETSTPAASPQEWLLLLDTLSRQLALFAERLRLKQQQARSRAERDELHLTLQTSKALARASPLLAGSRGVPVETATQWITAEALRSGRTVLELAEQVILQDLVSRQIAVTTARKAVAA